MDTLQASKVIDRLGGSVAVATLCEVSSQAVSKWRRSGIPNARLMYLMAIKPHVFADDGADGVGTAKQEAA